MGIKNLTKLIKAVAPNALRQIDFALLNGKRVAVDANLFVHKFLHGAEANSVRAMYGFLELNDWFVKFGVQAVFVFDGRKLDAKQPEMRRRYYKRKKLVTRMQNCKTKLKELEQSSAEAIPLRTEIASIEQQIPKVSAQQIDDCQQALKLAGLSVLIAEHEAEATCAALNRSGIVDAVVSEDMDSLCFGCNVMLRDCRPQKRLLTEIRLPILLKELDLSMSQFVDLCILCGCDFSSTLRSLNYVEALDAIKLHGSIEAILEHRECPQHFNYQEARSIFTNQPVLDANIFTNQKRSSELEAFLSSKS